MTEQQAYESMGFIRATGRYSSDIWFTWDGTTHGVKRAIDAAHATPMNKADAQTLVNNNRDFFSKCCNVRWFRIPEGQ